MRALVCRGFTGIDFLRVEDVARPETIPGGVRIAVHAAGVNFADTLIVRGEYQERPSGPFSPGMEVAGTVIDVGEGVDHLHPGDPVVAFLTYGGYAEEAVAHEKDVVRVPDRVDFITAATIPVVYATSHLALQYRARLQAGDVLLVHGASGGVGLTAVEVGKALGATVIATASSAEKLALAQAHGADHVVLSNRDVATEVRQLVGGVDVVFDPVGGEMFNASMKVIRPGGRILIIGFASGVVPQIPANHLLVKDASTLGFSLGQMRRHQAGRVQAAMRELLDWLADGRITPLVSGVYPLEQAADALREITERRATGKLAIAVRPSERVERITP